MLPEIERSVEVLQRTPAALSAMLGGVSDGWATSNYGPATFSPFDVVGHLVHAERTNWMPRVRHLLSPARNQPLAGFDRYAMYEASRGQRMPDLLATFAAERSKSLSDLAGLNLTAQDLARRGRHPQLGEVTVANVLAAWVVHDLGHTHQVAKAMAYQYRDAVGPFRELLTILPRVATDDS